MNIETLETDLCSLIGKHVSWLDGRTFQKAALRVAEGMFEDDDLDTLVNVAELTAALEEAFKQVGEESDG